MIDIASRSGSWADAAESAHAHVIIKIFAYIRLMQFQLRIVDISINRAEFAWDKYDGKYLMCAILHAQKIIIKILWNMF